MELTPRYSSRDLPDQVFVPGNGVAGPRFEDAGFNFGVDLFNHGFLWEAHEVWEGLWREAEGKAARGLRGLIQCAACALKARMGNEVGAVGLERKAQIELAASGAGLEMGGLRVDLMAVGAGFGAWIVAGPGRGAQPLIEAVMVPRS